MSAAFSLEQPIDGAEEIEVDTARTALLSRPVEFVCPICGDERPGAHVDVDGDDGTGYVECCTCHREFDVAVLRVPTRARLDAWRADAALHGTTALLCADGVHRCSFLAEASLRRLAPELTPIGKTRLLRDLIGSLGEPLSGAQRIVAAELGAVLGLPSSAINATIALA